MAAYPNQKHFTIHRINPLTEKKQFLSITCENLSLASRNLNGEIPFKFYLYLAANADNYDFDYSPQHFANVYGVSLDSARRAADKLVEAGYLVKSDKHKNGYEFFETPQIKEEKPSIKVDIQEEKRLIQQDNGEYIEMTYTEVYNELKNDYPVEIIKQFWESAKEVNA